MSSRFASIARRRPRLTRATLSDLARRLAHFWVVWSALLLVHELGHAVGARQQGLTVRRVTAGAGPVLWRTQRGDTEIVLRLVPIAGVTTFGRPDAAVVDAPRHESWDAWQHELTTIAGGVLATLAFAMVVAGAVAVRERATRTRWRWGRYVVADAVVLTLFNFLPVPPLDGGRAVIGALNAWGGIHLTSDALFWVQLGGLALAIVPMALWTRWTERIDAAALHWGAPPARP
ncbi:MAG TPA: M50 family metallopeptidase [Gemmatimonadaceae bacterium]|nr:M50 family metallopeptidase [Gemmatimonadaceae bacterium]